MTRAWRRTTTAVATAAVAGRSLGGTATARAGDRRVPLDPSATPLARAIADANPAVVRRAVFPAVPPGSKPAAVSTTPLAGFPRSGGSYAILSTGNARYARLPNREPDRGAESGGPSIRGARCHDHAHRLRVPRGANCLSFRYRFLSEEFPEFVNDLFNDAFIAELGHSAWDASSKADPTVSAPGNFARDSRGNPIRVNTIGDVSVTASRAAGTTYDAATRILRASTRIRPGLRHLYLSIFDQGDRIYDSAVFIDKLIVGRRARCKTGVVVDR